MTLVLETKKEMSRSTRVLHPLSSVGWRCYTAEGVACTRGISLGGEATLGPLSLVDVEFPGMCAPEGPTATVMQGL